MKKILFFSAMLWVAFSLNVKAQAPANNSCFSPVTLTPGTSCSGTSGTTLNATQSYAGCSGNADDDVWYTFIATGTNQNITVTPSAGFDAVIQLYPATCGSVGISCRDVNAAGVAETLSATGLTVGTSYLVRVYHFGAGSGTSTFTICVVGPPDNNICGSAVNLPVNTSCSNTAGTTFLAHQSFASNCGAGNADDDVWYSFMATASTNTITVTPSGGFDAVIELHSSCTATNLACTDVGAAGVSETMTASGLIPGETYLVRVYHYAAGSGSGTFNICVTGPAPVVPTNDEPCTAIALPSVTTDCNYTTYSNTFATETSTALAPAPGSCTGGVADGGYSTDAIEDVWFSMVVPSTGLIHVQAYPNVSAGYVNDAVMALYTGSSCSALTQVACSEDNDYPGSSYDNMPVIRVSSLTPGSTVYLRYWSNSDNSTGNFGLCVTTATNDACSTSLYVCDLNGYSATTSSAFTVDRPSNMRGNAEEAVTYNYTPGVNQSGVFGSDPPQAGSTGAPNYDVQIDNNSWVRFTAGASTATFTVTIGNCWINKGVQMQIFSATNCTNFAAVSDFREGTGSYTISAQGLVPYQDYYLMVDGWGGDICNYTIAALSGVLFPEIAASSVAVCANTPVTLTGPAGASSYSWNTGQTVQTITVTPSGTTTYSLTVTGVCGATQNLTKTVTVNTTPDITSTATATAICSGTAMSHTLTANVASNYSWTAVNNNDVGGEGSGTTNVINNTLTNTTLVDQVVVYNVTPTSASGNCPGSTETVSVTVRPRPQLTDPADISVCSGEPVPSTTFTTTLAGSTYAWVASNNSTVVGLGTSGSGNISGTAQTVTSLTSTNFTVTPTSAGGCSGSTQTFSISVKPKPAITAVASNTYCGNATVPAITFVATPTTSVNWTSSGTNTGLSTASGIGSTPSFTAIDAATVTTSTISLNASLDGCNANQQQYTITVNPRPQYSASPVMTPSQCGLSDGGLTITATDVTGTGTIHYAWTNSTPVSVGTDNPSLINQPAGSYNVTITDDYMCPKTFGPYTITNPGAPNVPSVAVTGGDNTKCVGEIIELTGVSTGTTTATYAWSGPNGASSTTNTLTINSGVVANSGTYTLTVTENNCSSSNTINITVNATPLASATSNTPTYCTGNTINLFGSGGVNYSWTGPDGFVSSDQNPTLTASSTIQTGTYSLTVTDANNCTDEATTSITVNQTPSDPVTAGSSNAVCEGDTIELFASSTPATSYGWIGPDVFVSSNQNPVIPNAAEANEGVYTIIASGSGCNSNPVLVNVTVNPNPNVTLSVSSNPLCSGEDVTLTASGANTIVWDYQNTNGATLQLNDVLVSHSGYYAVQISDGNGCSDRDSVLLVINETPAFPLITANDTVLCEGEDLSVTAASTGATDFSWTGPAGFTSSTSNASINNVVNANSGVYSVTASTAFCSSQVKDVIVTVNDTSTAYASAANTTLCSGNTLELVGVGGNNSEWSGPNGFTSTNQNETILNVSTLASGTYTYTAINNPGDCRHSATVNITVNETPVLDPIQANDTILCEGENLTLSASSTGATTFSWTGPNGFVSGNASAQISNVVNANNGTYTVTASNGLCTSSGLTVDIVVNDTSTAFASAASTIICSGNSIALNGQGGNSYSWSGPNGFVSSNQNETITNASALASGTYTYTAINNPGDCRNSATVTITVNETPSDAGVSSTSSCNGGNATLSSNATGTVNWYSDSTLTNLVNTGNSYSPVVANGVDTFYVVVSNNGCTSSTQAVTVSNYNIVASISATPDSGNVPLPVVFTNNSIGVDASDTYQWTYNGATFATSQNAAYEFQQGGLFNVMMIATDNESGCTDTAYVTIFVDDKIRIVVPNVFTPNGDGTNDGFTVEIKGGKEAQGTIYNRWGQILHQWDALNVTWDGKVPNGEPVSDGIYFYIIKVTGYDGTVLDVPGNVTIVR